MLHNAASLMFVHDMRLFQFTVEQTPCLQRACLEMRHRIEMLQIYRLEMAQTCREMSHQVEYKCHTTLLRYVTHWSSNNQRKNLSKTLQGLNFKISFNHGEEIKYHLEQSIYSIHSKEWMNFSIVFNMQGFFFC